MAFKIISPHAAGYQRIEETSTTKQHDLGTIVTARDDTYGVGEFIYLRGIGSTTVGALVTYNVGFLTALGTTAVGISNPFAVAMSANVANQYGWYQISGLAVGSTAGSVSFAATAAFAVASGEMIAATTTNRLAGAVVAVANPSTTSLLTVQIMINRPAGPSSD